MKITNQFETAGYIPPLWEDTPDGFLRVKARVLQEGILAYDISEMTDLPPELAGVNPIMMFIGVDSLSNPETLRSLEGARVVAPDHVWVSTDNVADISKGSAAGSSRMNGAAQEIDLLVTDAETIEQIKSKELQEISGGYHANAVYSPGEWNGQPFHLKQEDIFYNHLAIIKAGLGRAGHEIRILNTKKQTQEDDNEMADEKKMVRVKLRNTGKYVNTDEEGAAAIGDEDTAAETKSAGVEDTMNQLEEKKGSLADLQAEIEELKGELSVYKEKLDELLSEEAVENAADGMIEESGQADDIIENAFPDKEEKEKEKTEFKNSIRKVHGAKLRMMTLNAIKIETDGMSTEEIKGAFRAQYQIANAMKGKTKPEKVVSGQKMFQNMDSNPVGLTGHQMLGYK
jgi:hypothetical protein